MRSGSYEEALQLESFAKKLGKSYPNIKVISDIVAEVILFLFKHIMLM